MTFIVDIESEKIPWIVSLPTGWNLIRLKLTTNQVQNGIWGDEPNGSDDVICVRVAILIEQRLGSI
ncbi:hypothetical protein [Gloeocapsopsis dulcis]|uniref:hypothetical protein n=1 Tax=Gloeocapsopsis dulcis TaxID=2859516 RepID=UPI0018C59E14|nr:hypothetical protein [Gloeocapsopsis dulcis]WNN88688.1 hypothetical protein P0S91_20810 [Gloeocapsopsis dulcis]